MARKDITDLMVCKAYQEARTMPIPFRPWPYDLLTQWTGEPIKVCERAMERAYEHGLIEVGVSVRSGWLTEKGLQLLREGQPERS